VGVKPTLGYSEVMTTTEEPRRPGARQRAREAMTAQIADMAVDLFVTNGYEQTTVEDICRVAEISRTTFFRYFGSKEELLLLGFDDLGASMLANLVQVPETETPWAALRRSIEPLAAAYARDQARNRLLVALVIATPSLGPLHLKKLQGWTELLRPEIARRLGRRADDPTDPAPGALVACALACLDAALAAWVASDEAADLRRLFEHAADAIG